MLPPVDLTRLLGRVSFDPFYLFLMPVATRWPPGLLWGGAALIAPVRVRGIRPEAEEDDVDAD